MSAAGPWSSHPPLPSPAWVVGQAAVDELGQVNGDRLAELGQRQARRENLALDDRPGAVGGVDANVVKADVAFARG